MKCPNCGAEVQEGDVFCSNCGASVQTPMNYNYNMQQQNMQNYNQQNYNQPNYSQPNQPNYNQPKKGGSDNTVKYLVIALIVIALIIAVVLIVKTVLDNSNDKQNVEPDTPKQSFENETNTYKVNYAGFNLYIPEDLLTEKDGQFLLIGDIGNTWLTQMLIDSNSFNKVQSNLPELKSNWEDSGYDVNSLDTETIDGEEIIIGEINSAGRSILFYCAELTPTKTMVGFIFTTDISTARAELDNIIPIIKTAEYVGESSNLEIDSSMDFENALKELQNVANESEETNTSENTNTTEE